MGCQTQSKAVSQGEFGGKISLACTSVAMGSGELSFVRRCPVCSRAFFKSPVRSRERTRGSLRLVRECAERSREATFALRVLLPTANRAQPRGD